MAGEALSGPEIAPGEAIATQGDVAPNSSVAYTNAETGQPEVLVRLADGEFVAYSAVGTHQQRTVAYQPQTRQLVCPCHGGVYDPARGAVVVSGPPPRPLPRAEIEIEGWKVFSSHSAPPSTFSRIFFSTRTPRMICLQNGIIRHAEYSIPLGGRSSKGTAIIHRYGAPFEEPYSKIRPDRHDTTPKLRERVASGYE